MKLPPMTDKTPEEQMMAYLVDKGITFRECDDITPGEVGDAFLAGYEAARQDLEWRIENLRDRLRALNVKEENL